MRLADDQLDPEAQCRVRCEDAGVPYLAPGSHPKDNDRKEVTSAAAWFRGAEGRQVLAYPPCITDEASEVLDAFVRAQHHPDSMRQRRHCGARRLVEHLNDVDRTMRSRLRNPRTRRHPLSARIT